MPRTTFKKLIRMDYYTFEAKHDAGKLEAAQPYAIAGRPGEPDEYAWSPDGIGCFYYETYEEMESEHA